MARPSTEDLIDPRLALTLDVFRGALNMFCPLVVYLINAGVVVPKDLLPYYDEYRDNPDHDEPDFATLMPWIVREALQQIVNGDDVRDPQWLRAVIDGSKSGRAPDSGRNGETHDDE